IALREAVDEQVLVAGEDGRLCFRHALLREAMYDDLLPGERGELHLALARALEARCVDGAKRQVEQASTIASHYAGAGDHAAAALLGDPGPPGALPVVAEPRARGSADRSAGTGDASR